MSKSGPKGKPVSRHKDDGTYRKDRHAGRPDVTAPADIKMPGAPTYLGTSAKKVYRDIVKRLAESGIHLRPADAYVVERAAIALDHARNAEKFLVELVEESGSIYYSSKYGRSVHPAAREARQQWEAFGKAAAVLGLTPWDRERLLAGLDNSDDDDDLDDLDDHEADAADEPAKPRAGGGK